jgi:hypothetical protein
MSKIQEFVLILAAVVMIAGGLVLQSDNARAGSCPSGAGCGCSLAYAPVVCGGNCRYVNMCKARCAGWVGSQCRDAGGN